MEKTTIYLTDDLRQALRRHLSRTGARQSDVVREALAEYLAAADPGLPESVGIADLGDLDATNYEDELERAWADDGTAPIAHGRPDDRDEASGE